ncbi:hypothetical protein VWS92_001435 [Cronobacter sakazakii]|nr:hypothetical protein [Cronobacter sakazakii]EME2046578.1 hypothetical protein [Cronobacter sakazakii]
MKDASLSTTAATYREACELLRSGYVKHVRLGWDVGSDAFVISLKGFPVPRQH